MQRNILILIDFLLNKSSIKKTLLAKMPKWNSKWLISCWVWMREAFLHVCSEINVFIK